MNDRSSIEPRDNWLTIHERVPQCSIYSVYKFFTFFFALTILYVPLEINGVHTRPSYQKLNGSHQKTNVGQKSLSYLGPSHWNNLSKTIKTSSSLNAFKHNIKQHYVN